MYSNHNILYLTQVRQLTYKADVQLCDRCEDCAIVQQTYKADVKFKNHCCSYQS